MSDKSYTQTTDPIGDAIRELVDLNDINDHISMRVILGRIVDVERERCAVAVRRHWRASDPNLNEMALAILREIENG
jgi:hypothetical protein